MQVLVVNCGSSSIKYQLLNMETEAVLAKGLVDRIGLEGSVLTHQPEGMDKVVVEANIFNHSVGIKMVLDALIDADHGVIASMSDINAVGHRIVSGGEKFAESVLVTQEVKEGIIECYDMAPLHNPAHMLGINACEELMPGVPQVVVFDNAFHQTMPKYAFMYGLPYEIYEKYHVRKYGAHGTSHRYVAQRAAEFLGRPQEELKLITCHLGNGSSITAVNGGHSVDTSMGFTPLEGLIMGTRCGDVDPAVIPFIMKKEGFTPEQMDTFINKKSGVLGISGLSSDFRDLENAAQEGNERARLALDMFAYRVRRYIGAFVAAMNGVDAVVFTAGLGENGVTMRERICQGLDWLGTSIDPLKNQVLGKEAEISVTGSAVKLLVIPTNEELMIARDTKEICEKLG